MAGQPYAIDATFHRTALLLGLRRGDAVHRWAVAIIERDPHPPAAFFDIISVPIDDLSEMRHALWPLVIDPEPSAVLEALLAGLDNDLTSGRRSFQDTLTVLRQMRSMLRLPRHLYEGLNAALVAQAEDPPREPVVAWLRTFAGSNLAEFPS